MVRNDKKKTHNNCIYVIISQHYDGTDNWQILPQKGKELLILHDHMWPLLLTWINFNPSMDKWSHAQ